MTNSTTIKAFNAPNSTSGRYSMVAPVCLLAQMATPRDSRKDLSLRFHPWRDWEAPGVGPSRGPSASVASAANEGCNRAARAVRQACSRQMK